MREKDLKADTKMWSPRKHRQIAKFVVPFLLIGFAFRLFWGHFPVLSPLPGLWEAGTPPAEPGIMEFGNGKCNLFTGKWIPEPSGPLYTNETCSLIEGHQNCMKNGKPDLGYLYWRWKPHGCELPRFDAVRFMNAMRNKSWAFIGDSICRNHVQSLICVLSKADTVHEIYHDKEYKSRKWRLPAYNFTLALIWSPFLVKADIDEDSDGVSKSDIQLYLDILDKKWTEEYMNFDYMVISGGQWFLKTAIYWEDNAIIGCHYCSQSNLTERGFEYAYAKVLELVFNFLTTSAYKGTVLFRTSAPDHFEHGEWSNGGKCNRRVPFSDGEIELKTVTKIFYSTELQEFNKVQNAGTANGAVIKLLDATHLSLLRPDGHPGPYRHFHPFAANKTAVVQNDCLHWCLPGPLESWNDIIMEMIFNQ